MTRSLFTLLLFAYAQVFWGMPSDLSAAPELDKIPMLPTMDLGITPMADMSPQNLGVRFNPLPELPENILTLENAEEVSMFNFDWWSMAGISNTDYVARHIFDNDSIPQGLSENFAFLDAETQASQVQAISFLEKVAGESGGLGRLMTRLSGLEKVKFPVGIRDTVAEGIVVMVAIEGIMFTDSFATLRNLFMGIEYSRYPDNPLIFGAPEIAYSRTGGFRRATLGLIGDFAIPINENNEMLLILKGFNPATGKGCVASIGCDGFESIQLASTLYLSRKLVEPVAPDGTPQDGYVHADLDGYFDSLDDWSGGVSFQQSFKVRGISQLIFSLREARFDASETVTDPSIHFPKNYFADPSNANPAQWQGLYIGQIDFSLDQFADIENTKDKLGGKMRNLIIDRYGVTGKFEVGGRTSPVISLDEGKIGNARISVDHIKVDVYKNQPILLGAGGRVALAALDDGTDDAGMLYNVLVAQNGWQFVAGLNKGDSIPFPLLKSTVLLEQGTTLAIGHSEQTDKTEIEVNLCGTVDLGKVWPTQDSTKSQGIHFENFGLQSAAPTIKRIGAWSIPTSFEMGLGPVHFSVREVGAGTLPTKEVVIAFTADASFSGSGGFDIGGIAGIQIYGKENPDSNHRLVYDRLEVSKVGLCIATESWGANVELNWFEKDPKYGDGFIGRAAVGLKSMGYRQNDQCEINAGIYARALFGKKDSARYYNFELLHVDLDQGLQMGALSIHALGGSVSNNLRRAGIEKVAFENVNYADTAEVIAAKKVIETQMSRPSIGKSLLGLTYQPDKAAGFSIRLMTIAALRKKAKIANMRADLVFAFNDNKGLDSVRLDVVGQMFADLTLKKMDVLEIPVSFKAHILYDVHNKIFDLAAQVKFNISVRNVATIVGGGNLKIYAQENYGWYIHVGYPGELNNVGITLPLIGLKTNTYFCAGSTNVPDMPLLPAPIRNMFSSTTTQRQFNTGDDLAGLAFGTHLALGSAEEKNFFIFYYKLHVLLGFDVNLRNYEDYLCSGYTDFGVRKWYAKGQAYAYIHGAIGLRSGTQKFPILDLEAGFKIYLETPNPTYGEFGIAVKYKVLGGLIRGRAKVEASFGDKCFMDRGNIDVDVFEEVVAPVNEQALNVAQDITFTSGVQFEQPFPDDMGEIKLRVQLKDNISSDASSSFSTGASSPWADAHYFDADYDQIDDNTGENIPPGWYDYRQGVEDLEDSFEKPSAPTHWPTTGFAFYKEGSTTKYIKCRKEYSEDNTFVTYIPEETWPPSKDIWLQPQAHFQQSPVSQNQWIPVPDDHGNTFQDTVYRFKTGAYPEDVPPYNMDWTYPVKGMTNYYPKQVRTNGNYAGMVKLRKSMSPLLDKLHMVAHIVCHDHPTASFTSPCTYDAGEKLIYWSMPPDQMQRGAMYSISFMADEREIIEPIHFRCSKYDDLDEKLNRISERIGEIEWTGTSRVFIPMDEELFDEVELYGRGKMPPLLTFSYDLQDLHEQEPVILDQVSDEALDLDKNFFMQNYIETYDAFQEVPTVEVIAPDQFGAKPSVIDAKNLRQYLISNVHTAFLQAKADRALPEPDTNEERLSDALYKVDVDDWLGTWQHPPTLKINWNYTIGEFSEGFSFEFPVKQEQE